MRLNLTLDDAGSTSTGKLQAGATVSLDKPGRDQRPVPFQRRQVRVQRQRTRHRQSTIGGRTLFDTNQTARPSELADGSKRTLISDTVPPGDPNSTMANAHAEIGLIQQAFDVGLTRGQNMSIVVRGEAVCSCCQSNLSTAAERSGLNSLQVVDTVRGRLFLWIRGRGWVE